MTRDLIHVKPSREFRRAVAISLLSKGWTQKDLGKAIGASRVAVNVAINHGHNSSVLDRIRRKLNITIP